MTKKKNFRPIIIPRGKGEFTNKQIKDAVKKVIEDRKAGKLRIIKNFDLRIVANKHSI